MAASSSGRVSYSCMRQPSLIKQLKSILSEYPDGGQILKELIQNAEDAGAREIKFLCDERRINDSSESATQQLTKFFKGPALLVYNDEVFTDDDWEGIQMIYSSLKEKEPFKVGRFGLGFKSVFHITDHPCVISGTKILMIDPSQPDHNMVNAMVDISDIGHLEGSGLNARAFWSAFENMFGFDIKCVRRGHFNGTIFRFPLRERPTQLSRTLYDTHKVMELFDVFRSEASGVLLFLKSLECIVVGTLNSRKQNIEIARVEVNDKTDKVKKEKNDFSQKLKIACADSKTYNGPDIVSCLEVCIHTTQRGVEVKDTRWYIVNYFVGDSASDSFRTLIQDESLCFSPYVGVAVPVSYDETNFNGHVFCFLPLPNESCNQTGLPVHVNGYFALSQSRHHIKWETDDQQGKKLDDLSILWNKRLITEALPLAYKTIVKYMISKASQVANSSQAVADVYSCLPISQKTASRWKLLEQELYRRLTTVRFLFCRPESRWISLTEACFATFYGIPRDVKHVKMAVIRCLHSVGKQYVDIPVDVFRVIKGYFQHIQDLSPSLLSQYLHLNQGYFKLQSSEKIYVLHYLFSDGKNYGKVNGLQLLQLESNRWVKFDKYEKTIYSCTPEVVMLLRGMEDRIISTTYQQMMPVHVDTLCGNGETQVKKMTTEVFVDLVEELLKSYFGYTRTRQLDSSSRLSVNWLKDLWSLILNLGEVSKFQRLTIVPLLKAGTWAAPRTVELKALSDWLLVKSSKGIRLTDGVCRCLEIMGVTVLDTLPDWIPQELVKSHFIWSTPKSIATFLSKIAATDFADNVISSFNSKCKPEDKTEFATYLAGIFHFLEGNSTNLLQQLFLFKKVQKNEDYGTFASVYETRRYILETNGFPNSTAYPFACLAVTKAHENLIRFLGGIEVSIEELIVGVLKKCENNLMHASETSEFMEYIIENFYKFQRNLSIVNSCRRIKFLTVDGTDNLYKASDLFDPSDSIMQALFYAESFLPKLIKGFKFGQIEILKFIGLKSQECIDGRVMLHVAKTLDTFSSQKRTNASFDRKSEAFMDMLKKRPALLEERVSNGQTLAHCLKTLFCIPVLSIRPAIYPKCLDWFQSTTSLCRPNDVKEVSVCLIVGSQMPTVKCENKKLNDAFGWTSYPSIDVVINQLRMVRTRYTVRHQSELMASVKAIYEHMNTRQNELKDFKECFAEEALVLTAEGFVKAAAVVIKEKSDSLDLRPYVYPLPREFMHMIEFFESVGCKLKQDCQVLLETLHRIQHVHSVQQTENLVRRDRRIVSNILETLAQNVAVDESFILENCIPMMVHDRNPNVLKLVPVSECTYDDDPGCFYDTDENEHLVHEMIPHSVAEALGVRSVNTKAAQDAEELGVGEYGQTEELTSRINTLLRDGYTDGLSVPKELIQNADDAGASMFRLLYDERENMECRDRVLSKGLKDFQGPSMWVYNNAKFTSNDIDNIMKLNAATKKSDVRKIGKFGLGFCSVYNLTDLPSFITGKHFALFDPHEKHLESILRKKTRGVKYKLPNKTLTSRYVDQFKPYHTIFGCNLLDDGFDGYDGTLFRLPLRNELQARESQIYKLCYSREEVSKLLHKFVSCAADFLLFLQNVQEIELYHLPRNGTQETSPTLLYRVRKENLRYDLGSWNPVRETVLSRIPLLMLQKETFLEIHRTTLQQRLNPASMKIIKNLIGMSPATESEWIISWAKGQDKSLQMQRIVSLKGSVPLAAVAYRCKDKVSLTPGQMKDSPAGHYREGHMFCFLPLPLQTNLQVHLNGCFAINTNRRNLITITEDDKDSAGDVWNRALLEDANVKAMLHLLKWLTQSIDLDQTYKYYHLWPTMCAEIARPFKTSFYRNIISSNVKVFRGKHEWLSFDEVIMLDPKLIESDIGKLAFEFLSQLHLRDGKLLIEMPENVLVEIRNSNPDFMQRIDDAVITEIEYYQLFLRNIEDKFWTNRIEGRNHLILCALKCRTPIIESLIRQTACIPTEPRLKLQKPDYLIHPSSELSQLYNKKDGRFPLDTKQFRSTDVLSYLVELGMHSQNLTEEQIVERCKTVQKLAAKCSGCAKERCSYILEYLSQDSVFGVLGHEEIVMQSVKDVYMFPVLTKPTRWKFPWKSDEHDFDVKRIHCRSLCDKHKNEQKTICLGKSEFLARKNLSDYIGMVYGIVEEDIFFRVLAKKRNISRLLKMLRINACVDEIPLNILFHQTVTLVESYNNASDQFSELQNIHAKLLKQYEQYSLKKKLSVEEINLLARLGNLRIVLVGDELVKKEKAVFCLKEEIKPYLYQVPVAERQNNEAIYRYLGVKDTFSISYIVKVMNILKSVWDGKKEKYMPVLCSLLTNLEHILEESELDYQSIQEHHDSIYAPDNNGDLYRTYELALENKDLSFDVALKILHPRISPLTGAKLGVKSKDEMCFETISTGISFGQHEDLVTRIRGLLKAYPPDESIMKELLQNADDAGATEIHFVKDYRNHPTERLFSTNCQELQGPSLLVFNNSFFTEKDLEGLHNLGQGSKSSDPTKTGQYGVGFNAVYHLTDTPSFISVGPDEETGEHLIILDPLCKHVPKATKLAPGQMFNLHDVERNFPNHLAGFGTEQLLFDKPGTVFRFPLRKQSSEISKNVISIDFMNSLLTSFSTTMHETLLFLKNVTRIKISDITSGTMVEECTVIAHLSEKSTTVKDNFYKKVKTVTERNKDQKQKNLDEEPFSITYDVKIVSNRGKCEKFVVAQQFGFKECDLFELKKEIADGNLGLLPFGGVAIQVDRKSNDVTASTLKLMNEDMNKLNFSRLNSASLLSQQNNNSVSNGEVALNLFFGKAFCFLPLPIYTGLPVHVNGHFALDHEARRELWKGGYRHDWNKCVIDCAVVPVWISALIFIQKKVEKDVEKATAWKTINEIMKWYHAFFPVSKHTTADFWKDVAMEFYRQTLQSPSFLFPYIFDRRSEIKLNNSLTVNVNRRFSIHWTNVTTTLDNYLQGTFNVIMAHLPYMTDFKILKEQSILIGSILKAFGMKLIETPSWMIKQFEDAGIKCMPKTSPEVVISFLKTWNTQLEVKCQVGKINVPIEESTFLSTDNLYLFVEYLTLDKKQIHGLNGLPILLTEDGIFKACSNECPVFSTRYSKLLPLSAFQFVHTRLRPLLEVEELFQSGLLKRFHLHDFIELLPLSVDIDIYKSGMPVQFSDAVEDQVITAEWLTLFIELLCEFSVDDKNETEEELSDILQNREANVSIPRLIENIEILGQWSFLPTVQNNVRCLLPLMEKQHVLYLTYLQRRETVGEILLKLGLPELDIEVFNESSNRYVVCENIRQCVASTSTPVHLLKCLQFHTTAIKRCKLLSIDAIELLAFFSRHVSILAKEMGESCVTDLLRNLPMFPSLQNTLVSIDENDVVVIPPGMPTEGIQEWAYRTGTTLLQEIPNLKTLYEFLGLEQLPTEEVYAEKILPTIGNMPQGCWMRHIEFLKNLIGNVDSFSECQIEILQLLKDLCFLNVNGVLKRANQLYDPHNEIFACMLSWFDFPPIEFRSSSWRRFLKTLGLIHDVSDDHLLKFTREIERYGRNRMDDSITFRSQLLLDCFLQREDWNPQTYNEIAKIRFILPYRVDRRRRTVFSNSSNTPSLICFQSSVSSTFANLCWSCADLLPSFLFGLIHKKKRAMLGIYEEPPIETVILHCQNVVDALKNMLHKNEITDEFVKELMSGFYTHFDNNVSSAKLIRSRLQFKPIIHLPDENDLVTVNEIVIDLSPDQEIKPYLFRSPKYYGQFDRLFNLLGCKRQIMFQHYADVLQKIKYKCGDSELMPIEILQVQKVLLGLLVIKTENDNSCEDVRNIYLINEIHVLKESSRLIFSNTPSFKRRLEGRLSLDFCVDSSFLGVGEQADKMELMFSSWPGHLKPVFLSDIVKEIVCLDGNEDRELKNSLYAGRIEQFLHSNLFLNAVCRLLKHQRYYQKKPLPAEHSETEISRRLCSIHVIEMTELRTVLYHNERVVPGTEKDIQYHVKTPSANNSSFMFYFQNVSERNKISVRLMQGLIYLIRSCIPGFTTDSDLYLLMLFQTIDNSENLSHLLDDLQVKPYNFVSEEQEVVFPKPGTYVESQFIPFLEQGITSFRKYEYQCVAMELEDSLLEDNGNIDEDPIFIYVRILGEKTENTSLDLQKIYMVDTGNLDMLTQEIPIHRLYRFVRREKVTGKELQKYEAEPIGSRPFDEQARRIRDDLKEAWAKSEVDRKRIIRRLMLKWHPDKNHGNEDYCTKMCQYIKIVISRLENGEEVIDDFEKEMSRGPSKFSKGTSDYYDNVNRRASNFARKFDSNWDSYNRAEPTYTHSHQAKHVDLSEAKRWLRQAKKDFEAAEMMSVNSADVDGFNWVCYTCHQACEKALKAVLYSLDANDVPRGARSHNLLLLTKDPELVTLARELENKLENVPGLRYPDALLRPKIPSEIYTQSQAEYALKKAKQLIALAEKRITEK